VLNGILPNSIDLLYPSELKDFILMCIQKVGNRPSATQLLDHSFLNLDQESDDDNLPIKLKEVAEKE
jgi:hypothetical protein